MARGDPADKYTSGYEAATGGGSDDSTTSSGSFIGVPKGYSVPANYADAFKPGGMAYSNPGGPGMMQPSGMPHQPQYPAGAENDIRQLSTENLARLQGQLAIAGLIGPETRFRVGIPDSTTINAYKTLLGVANNYAISETDALQMLKEKPSLLGNQVSVDAQGNLVGGTGASLAHTETRTDTNDPMFTDPVTARGVLRDTLQQRLGREPTADEYHQFRHLLRNKEGGQDVTTTVTKYGKRGQVKSSVSTPSDNTTDPSAADVADDMSRRGDLGREANVVRAASFMDIIARRVGA